MSHGLKQRSRQKPDGSFVNPVEAMQLNIYQMSYDEVLKYDVGNETASTFSTAAKNESSKAVAE
jgi:hypothetical protein